MEIAQVYNLVNSASAEVIGDSAVLNEDLTNVVDIGNSIINTDGGYNKFVTALVNHIGKVVFVNRPYSGSAPSVLMDAWEYGSIMEKISSDMPDATINESWELTDGASYDPFVYNAPKAEAKFFNKMVTFEIDRSIMDRQLRDSFSSATQLNSFISMLYNEVDKSLTIKNDALIMRTINNAIAETIYNQFSTSQPSSGSGMKAVNLLYLYNQRFSPTETLTAQAALTDPSFIRFASYMMGLYVDRLSRMSTLFNIGGKQRFTPRDSLHIILLSEFDKAAGVYLYDAANQYNSENIRLPRAEVVPFWQGSGTDYAFANTSKINVTTAAGNSVEISGVLGVMFDRDALGVANFNSRVTTQYNAKAEFTNYFYKRDARYFNDLNENFIVFYVA